MHGGIGRCINRIEQIAELERPITMEVSQPHVSALSWMGLDRGSVATAHCLEAGAEVVCVGLLWHTKQLAQCICSCTM
jgi:hypothetical protein